MKKINWTIVALTLVSITELIVNHNLEYSLWLWVGYGAYKVLGG